jgi:hypothetical protein
LWRRLVRLLLSQWLWQLRLWQEQRGQWLQEHLHLWFRDPVRSLQLVIMLLLLLVLFQMCVLILARQ